MGAMLIPAFQADGLIMIQRAEPLADKLVAVARKHDGFYELLKTITSTSIYGALAAEVGTILLMIGANHGFSIPGIPLPSMEFEAPAEEAIA